MIFRYNYLRMCTYVFIFLKHYIPVVNSLTALLTPIDFGIKILAYQIYYSISSKMMSQIQIENFYKLHSIKTS